MGIFEGPSIQGTKTYNSFLVIYTPMELFNFYLGWLRKRVIKGKVVPKSLKKKTVEKLKNKRMQVAARITPKNLRI